LGGERAVHRANHRPDGNAVLLAEFEIALIVRRHSHNGARSVGHQYEIANPDRDFLAAIRVARKAAGEKAFLFDVSGIAIGARVDHHLRPRSSVQIEQQIAQRMLRRQDDARSAENGVDSGGEYANGRDGIRRARLYQPKIDLVSGRIAGMEALLRVKDDKQGLLLPHNFVPIAEETGLIVTIGEWVMREACAFNKSLHDRGLPAISVAINLSARQLVRGDLVRTVEQALRDTGMAAEYLELELTESMVMHGPENVVTTLGQLEALGVQLSIDDFGTGYSSLSYLKRFPVSSLKVDQSFVRDLGQDDNAAAIVKAVISLGHSLDLKVIAEGVETEKQMAFLLENHCDGMQGFLFSRPLAAEDFITLLERESRSNEKFSLLRQLCASVGQPSPQQLSSDVAGT